MTLRMLYDMAIASNLRSGAGPTGLYKKCSCLDFQVDYLRAEGGTIT